LQSTKHDGDMKMGNFQIGAGIARDGVNLSLEANLLEFKTHGVEMKTGLNLGIGGAIILTAYLYKLES